VVYARGQPLGVVGRSKAMAGWDGQGVSQAGLFTRHLCLETVLLTSMLSKAGLQNGNPRGWRLDLVGSTRIQANLLLKSTKAALNIACVGQ
jgi:hypothetical protein